MLRPRTIITTNFDRIPDWLSGSSLSLDATSKSGNSQRYRVFTNNNVTEANNAWREGQHVIFKMHGCVSNQDSIVFTREDFRHVLHLGIVKEFLKTIFRSETGIFLDFGFSDPHIDSILSFLREVSEGLASPHYVLSNDLSNYQKNKLQRNYGVRVINYTSSDGHPEVPEFIRLLTYGAFLVSSTDNHTFLILRELRVLMNSEIPKHPIKSTFTRPFSLGSLRLIVSKGE